ncbi:sigma factor-like helix-turn-helix DNA-binding protein [Catellatospora aurea]|uniref:Sigma factor-like helix-turn-helix DNA-binding protein n=1 Tax=Catellatospora aurea TaxID=1337874 RepID=A0ABW2H8A8_9ACTN
MDDFGEFYAARKDAVYRALLVATRGQPGAEDAVAEAFTRAYARWDVVRAHPNPTAWVLRTALNEQRSWWRRLRRELPGDPPDVGGVADRAPGGLDARLRALVMALPTRQREVVALRLLADLSAEETGRTLRIGAATVHVHLHRALATLRFRLAAATGDGSLVREEL